LIFQPRPAESVLARRTARSLRLAGFADEDILVCPCAGFATALAGDRPVLILRAGAWLAAPEHWSTPAPSATGRGLCAVGAVLRGAGGAGRPAPDDLARLSAWRAWFAPTGGDLDQAPARPVAAEWDPLSLFLDAAAVREVARTAAANPAAVLRASLGGLRVVHLAALDARFDPQLRIMQLITSLQRGGAERVTLDLVAALAARGMTVRLATLGRSLRATFPAPPGTIDLAAASPRLADRADLLARGCARGGFDLVHGHLIPAEVARRLSLQGLPVILTIHNTAEAWPKGMTGLARGDAALLAACAEAVARDLHAAAVPVPIRTARNGVDLQRFRRTAAHEASRAAQRLAWGFGADDFVLVALANPRPQKRLDRMPAILAALRDALGPEREARLVLCGEAMPGDPKSAGEVARVTASIGALGLTPHVRWAGTVAEVTALLAACDALVSPSAHEGLSLACLEALAMGLAVVATRVGGTPEIARDHPALRLVAPDAGAGEFAGALLPLASLPPAARAAEGGARPPAFLRQWSLERMAARYETLSRRVVARAAANTRPDGLWLIANNFSTGGAQSSARRLLLGLAARGVRVRAAVVEEHPGHPTPGRAALLAAGIPVHAAPPDADPAAAREVLFQALDQDPPAAVLFWNLRPSFKTPLADGLLDTPVFDISPGEMYFESLAAFFARPDAPGPYREPREYGRDLAGVIVKYQAEAAQAAELLGAKVHVVPNGVPLPPPGKPRPADGRVVLGTAARLHPRKRIEDLLEAFALAQGPGPALELRIAGGVEGGCGSYAEDLRRQAAGLPVVWVGETFDLAAFHAGLDLFVMISEPAGCPNASLEAMAAGLPVIATDVGGASEQVLEGETGRLTPARDAAALARAIRELGNSPEQRLRFGAAGRARAEHHFNLDRMVSDYLRLCLPPGPA